MNVTLYTPDDIPTVARPLPVHHEHRLPVMPDFPLPLCWVAEGKQRGGDDEAWTVSVDHEALPMHVTSWDASLVTCAECREQANA